MFTEAAERLAAKQRHLRVVEATQDKNFAWRHAQLVQRCSYSKFMSMAQQHFHSIADASFTKVRAQQCCAHVRHASTNWIKSKYRTGSQA